MRRRSRRQCAGGSANRRAGATSGVRAHSEEEGPHGTRPTAASNLKRQVQCCQILSPTFARALPATRIGAESTSEIRSLTVSKPTAWYNRSSSSSSCFRLLRAGVSRAAVRAPTMGDPQGRSHAHSRTISHVGKKAAGLVLAGSGRDLQNARAPRYVLRKGRVVALVAMATDFIPYGKASYARPESPGVPVSTRSA